MAKSMPWPVGFSFNEARAVEIAAYLIQKVGRNGTLNYTKLLKLLYLIDRRALLAWRRRAVGGAYVSMDNGPVMSETYDLIKDSASGAGIWADHIERHGRYSVRVRKDPGTGRFTKALRAVIEEVIAEHGSKTFGELFEYCHKALRRVAPPRRIEPRNRLRGNLRRRKAAARNRSPETGGEGSAAN